METTKNELKESLFDVQSDYADVNAKACLTIDKYMSYLYKNENIKAITFDECVEVVCGNGVDGLLYNPTLDMVYAHFYGDDWDIDSCVNLTDFNADALFEFVFYLHLDYYKAYLYENSK